MLCLHLWSELDHITEKKLVMYNLHIKCSRLCKHDIVFFGLTLMVKRQEIKMTTPHHNIIKLRAWLLANELHCSIQY